MDCISNSGMAMDSQANNLVEDSFRLIFMAFHFIGVYPFMNSPVNDENTFELSMWFRVKKWLILVYSVLISAWQIFTLSLIALPGFLHFYSSLYNKNFRGIIFYFIFVFFSLMSVEQIFLYWMRAKYIKSYVEKWSEFEFSYKSETGNDLQSINKKKFRIEFTILTVVPSLLVYYCALTIDSDILLSKVLYGLAFQCFILAKVYTEMMLRFFCNAMENCAAQLNRDYKRDLFLKYYTKDLTCYEKMWVKLSELQTGLARSLDTIYTHQLALLFIYILTFVFVIYEFFMQLVKWEMTNDPQFVVDTLVGSCLMLIWFISIYSATTFAHSAQEEINTKTLYKLQHLMSDEEIRSSGLEVQVKRFLHKVASSPHGIIFKGYGRLDKSVFSRMLFSWLNYTIILIQFRMSLTEVK